MQNTRGDRTNNAESEGSGVKTEIMTEKGSVHHVSRIHGVHWHNSASQIRHPMPLHVHDETKVSCKEGGTRHVRRRAQDTNQINQNNGAYHLCSASKERSRGKNGKNQANHQNLHCLGDTVHVSSYPPSPLHSNRLLTTVSSHPQGNAPQVKVPSPPPPKLLCKEPAAQKQDMQTHRHMNHKMSQKLPVGINVQLY